MYDNAYVHEIAIGAIDLDLEEPSDMWEDLIHHADEAHILDSEPVIFIDLVSGWTVSKYGPTLGQCVAQTS